MGFLFCFFFFFPNFVISKKLENFAKILAKVVPFTLENHIFQKTSQVLANLCFWEIASKICLFWDYWMTGRMFNPVDKSEYELWSWRLILSLLCSFWAARERKCSLSVVVLHSLFSVSSSSVFSGFLPSFLSIFLPNFFFIHFKQECLLTFAWIGASFSQLFLIFLKFLKIFERRKTERQRDTSSIFFRFFSFLLVNLPPNFSLFQTGVHSLESVLRSPSASCFSEFFWNKDRHTQSSSSS